MGIVTSCCISELDDTKHRLNGGWIQHLRTSGFYQKHMVKVCQNPWRIHGAAIYGYVYGNIYHQYTPNVSIYSYTWILWEILWQSIGDKNMTTYFVDKHGQTISLLQSFEHDKEPHSWTGKNLSHPEPQADMNPMDTLNFAALSMFHEDLCCVTVVMTVGRWITSFRGLKTSV